jgi:hypothetical protein
MYTLGKLYENDIMTFIKVYDPFKFFLLLETLDY